MSWTDSKGKYLSHVTLTFLYAERSQENMLLNNEYIWERALF